MFWRLGRGPPHKTHKAHKAHLKSSKGQVHGRHGTSSSPDSKKLTTTSLSSRVPSHALDEENAPSTHDGGLQQKQFRIRRRPDEEEEKEEGPPLQGQMTPDAANPRAFHTAQRPTHITTTTTTPASTSRPQSHCQPLPAPGEPLPTPTHRPPAIAQTTRPPVTS